MNLRRRGKAVYPHITGHSNSYYKDKSYSVEIIEVLSGNGQNENGIMDENIRRLRLVRKDFWMKSLRTNFPYGLKKRSIDLIPGAPIDSDGERNKRCHEKWNSRHFKVSLINFLNFLKNQIAIKSKDAFLKIRKKKEEGSNTCKKKFPKEIALFFLDKPVEMEYNIQFNQWNNFVLDIIDTKLFRSTTNVISPKKKILANVCTLSCVKKDMGGH